MPLALATKKIETCKNIEDQLKAGFDDIDKINLKLS